MSKNRKRKQGRKGRKGHKGRSSSSGSKGASQARSGGGVMTGMVTGFRRMAGAEKSKKKRGSLDTVLTVLLFAAAAALLAWRFL